MRVSNLSANYQHVRKVCPLTSFFRVLKQLFLKSAQCDVTKGTNASCLLMTTLIYDVHFAHVESS